MSNLTATYTSPAQSRVFTHTLPQPAPTTAPEAEARTAHLSALQTSIKALQADINVFLTEKMSEDKMAAENAGAAGVKRARDGDDDDAEDLDEEGGYTG